MNGIFFKPDMHLAIQENRKTVTRRLDHLKEINLEPDAWIFKTGNRFGEFVFWNQDTHKILIVKPRYKVGEVVYIKEAWSLTAYPNTKSKYYAVYRDGEHKEVIPTDVWIKSQSKLFGKWRSPLFMPAWAARDFIQFTDVRPERLQEITEGDAKKEGVWLGSPLENELVYFKELWDSINPKYLFSSNPHIWRYEFKRVGND